MKSKCEICAKKTQLRYCRDCQVWLWRVCETARDITHDKLVSNGKPWGWQSETTLSHPRFDKVCQKQLAYDHAD